MKKKSASSFGFFNLRTIVALLLCAAVICSILAGRVLGFFRPEAPANISQRTLTFEERVAYQKAIEEVYWRHRIWPKEHKDPKPSLDAVMSQAQLEKKVTDYLRNSQALEDYWQRPIIAEQLQAEMDRMAKHTRQPDVLRELFDALGNDPFVIAECLARPPLAQRLLTNWYSYDQRIHAELKQRAEAELQAHSTVEQMKQLSGKYSEIEFVKRDNGQEEENRGAEHSIKLNSREWDETVQRLAAAFGVRQHVAALKSADMSAHSKSSAEENEALPVGKLSPLQGDEERYYATAVLEKTQNHLKLATVSWPKEPFELWQVRAENHVQKAIATPSSNYMLPTISDGAGCFDDTWKATAGPPDGRYWHTAVWTGTEMIIWGGVNDTGYLSSSGRYNPATDSWIMTSRVDAPIARHSQTAVWTGSEMIIWGGTDGINYLNTGGRYNPSTDSWIALGTISAPTARAYHTTIWTGSEMIVWGGYDGNSDLDTGGRYNPGANSWTATSNINPAASRDSHTAVWTGSEMIVWGGVGEFNYLNTGGRYNPVADSWTATSTTNAPTERYRHTAVWSGSEMIIWGGDNGGVSFNTGGRYNPATNGWTATTTSNAPAGRSNHTAVWTGTEMIVWGGFIGGGDANTGGRYNPITNNWAATSTTNAPSVRANHTAVWTGSEMIVWGGFGSNSYPNIGGRYNPITEGWVPTGKTPSRRSRHAAVWTGSEMVVWGGFLQGGGGDPYTNTGGTYNPTTDDWMVTNVANAPTGRELPTAVWTGNEMIVWGGYSYDGNDHYWNTGGKYNPGTNGWVATSTTNAPVGRESQQAVWTGNEMTVWGGYYYDGNDHYLNTGGRYNPSTNSWAATATTNAPSARASHKAVWTGTEMIVWGGGDSVNYLNTGGKYNPGTNSWMPMSNTGAPSARTSHTATWSGSEMIIWGGYFFDGTDHYLNTGGRYNPNANSWTPTSVANVPDARSAHTAVWSGTEMIVWGGHEDFFSVPFFNTGGRYNPGTDSWVATNTDNAPGGRYRHTIVWTGTEMIVWGGIRYTNTYTSTGGRYCAQSGPPPTPTPTPRVTPRPRPTPHVRPSP